METTLERGEKTPEANGKAAPISDEVMLARLKIAAYDTAKQIQFLSQVQLPRIEQQIAELTQRIEQNQPA